MHKIFPVIFILISALIAYYTGLSIASSDDNPIVYVCTFVMAVSIFVTLSNPVNGFYILIILGAFLDEVKRLMSLYNMISYEDIAIILAIPSVIVTTMILAILIPDVISKKFLKNKDNKVFLYTALIALANIGFSIRGAISIRDIGLAVNSGIFVLIIFPCSVLLSFEIINKIIWFGILINLPVALYGIYQSFFGLSAFEINYLLSGLSSTSFELDSDRVRPFSTLSSPHSYSMIMVFILLFCLILFNFKEIKKTYTLTGIKNIFIIPIYFTASILSFGRTAWIGGLMGLISAFCFGSKHRTIGLYLVATSFAVFFIINAAWIQDRLEWIQRSLPTESAIQSQAFGIQTYSDRLQSYQNIFTNPKFQTLLGAGFTLSDSGVGEETVHDAISQTLLRFGIVGSAVLFIITSLFLYKLHKSIFIIPDSKYKDMAIMFVAIVFLTLWTGIFSGSSLHVFPINFYFWFSIGCIVVIIKQTKEVS